VQNDSERRELRGLVERVKRGDCVLVLGPRLAVRDSDPARCPLDELLACDLLASLRTRGNVVPSVPISLRRAADLYYRLGQDREDLELTVQDFYTREAETTTAFHRDLARLPFKLCICASPDGLMQSALKDASKLPQKGHYRFKQNNKA